MGILRFIFCFLFFGITAVVTVATEVRHTRAQIKFARAREKSNR